MKQDIKIVDHRNYFDWMITLTGLQGVSCNDNRFPEREKAKSVGLKDRFKSAYIILWNRFMPFMNPHIRNLGAVILLISLIIAALLFFAFRLADISAAHAVEMQEQANIVHVFDDFERED